MASSDCTAPRGAGSRLRGVVLSLITLLALTACSQPPEPVPEPADSADPAAWRIATSDQLLERAIAHTYAIALTSHGQDARVVIDENSSPAELAAGLSSGVRAGESAASAEATTSEQDAEPDYDLVIARTASLLQQLQHSAEDPNVAAPDDTAQTDPQQLLDEIGEYYEASQLADPSAVVVEEVFVMGAATASALTGDAEETSQISDISAACDELHLGVWDGLEAAQEALSDAYDCAPEQLSSLNQTELVAALLHQQIDMAVLPQGNPAIAQNAWVSMEDSEQAFPRDQYLPVFAAESGEEAPAALAETSAALDDEGYEMLQDLITGPDPLSPQDAALFWLVDRGVVAAPEDWDR